MENGALSSFLLEFKGDIFFYFLCFYLIAIDFASVWGNILFPAFAGSATLFETG